MPSLLDPYLDRLRGGDIATFLTFQDALIKKYGKITLEQMALATIHELLLIDNLQEADLIMAFNTQMLLEQLNDLCSPGGNVMHGKADSFYSTAKRRTQAFITYIEDVLMYKHYRKDDLLQLLRQEDFLQHEEAINKHREQTSKIHRDDVYAYKALVGIPRSRDIDTYKQSNQGYMSFVQRFRNKLASAPVDDTFSEREREVFSRIYFNDAEAIPRKWRHYVEIAKTFLETSPIQKTFSLFKDPGLPQLFKERFSFLMKEVKSKSQQVAVMMAMVEVMKSSNLTVAADTMAKQMGFPNSGALETELQSIFKRFDPELKKSISAWITTLNGTKKSPGELLRDLKKSVSLVRFDSKAQSTEPKSALQETHASEEDHQLIIEMADEIEGNKAILYRNIHNLLNELNKRDQDKTSNEYKLCLVIIRLMQQNPKTASLNTAEQKTIFNYVIDKFVKKLTDAQTKYTLELNPNDLAIQVGKKIGNYFDRPSSANYSKFTTEVYPNIGDYIAKSDYQKQFSHFSTILIGPLTEYLKTSYTSEEFDPQNLTGFMVNQVNGFFATKTDELLEKHFQLMIKQQIQDYLADIAGFPDAAKENVEGQFIAHMKQSSHYQYKELKDFLLMISKPERVMPYLEQVIDNAIQQFMNSHQELLGEQRSGMNPL